MTNVLSTLTPNTTTGNHKNGTEEADIMAKYFLYVDESGDEGHNTACTTHYVLVGLILMEDAWNGFFAKLKDFRSALSGKYGLKLGAELRAQDIWNAGGAFKCLRLSYGQRYRLFRDVALFLRNSPELSIIAVSIDKSQPKLLGTSIKQYTWKLLIQRFENFLLSAGENGLIFCDAGGEGPIRGSFARCACTIPYQACTAMASTSENLCRFWRIRCSRIQGIRTSCSYLTSWPTSPDCETIMARGRSGGSCTPCTGYSVSGT